MKHPTVRENHRSLET